MTLTTLAPLLGVALGGLLSGVTQHSVRHSSERAEIRRDVRECAESRRSERLSCLDDFLAIVQEAERVAVDRYHHHESDEPWQPRARQTEDRMWLAQKKIHMLCPQEVNEAARRLAFATQKVIRNGPDEPGEPQDEKVWATIGPARRDFLDVVRDHLR
ncbi:hypothetical protein ACIQVT_23455 [Streptomyces sp. NPDC100445]|uniref:hypothetical protein n=1 Tax=Streptomyces sp. NPDC100445 TaxID=3366102 RepID=UPI00381ABA52